MTTKAQTYSIRPAGRHLLTIGRDLIQDQYAAIVELVKNAFDADSPDISITFQIPAKRKSLKIIIEDHGHGMSRDTVINKWLVPSTRDKLKRRESPNGRTMQGRKGIGRYAASILGEDLLLETVTEEGEKTEVYIIWSDFEYAEYLGDVKIEVNTFKTNKEKGTKLTITGSRSNIAEWDARQIKKLEYELKKLSSPVGRELANGDKDEFTIKIIYDGFWEELKENITKIIQPYPIFKLYDYRISGTVKADGSGNIIYSNQKAKNTIEEKILFNINEPTRCGDIFLDIRVYDREKNAIELLIKRGLKNDNGDYVGKLQARQLLNEYNGIGVYRNGFRIRPLGDPDFDWLKLNEQRVQNPSLRIGSNQVIGYVQIQSEEFSGLEEKSARDGLKENISYEKLKYITKKIIGELETRRFKYRSKAGLSRYTVKVERQLEKLFTFDDLKRDVQSRLKKRGIDKEVADEILGFIAKKEENNNRIADEIRETVAIYQGQATLGKIINVILHEGRRPLNYFKNQIPNINFWAKELAKTKKIDLLNEIIPLAEGLGKNADIFVKLFSRLDPLAAGKRGKKKQFDLHKAILDSFDVFENELLNNDIKFKVSSHGNVMFDGWQQDIYAIMTNLIDNSIYWIVNKKSNKRKIEINIDSDAGNLNFIDYRDTGPGIEAHLIEDDIIFEPEFTTKIDSGTGLGLAISGEAAMRNGLQIKVFDSHNGAYFRLQPILENDNG